MLVRTVASCLVLGWVSSIAFAATQSASPMVAIPNNTPKFTSTKTDLGPVSSATEMEVSVWLNVHNRSEMDTLAESLYDSTSPNFHRWISHSQFVSEFAPTAAELQTVQSYLTSNGLSIISVGPDNFSVTARGTVSVIEKAFSVSIHQFQVKGQVITANTTDPKMTGPVAALVSSVSGLNSMQFTHPYMLANGKGQSAPASGTGASGGGFQSLAGGTGSTGKSAAPNFFTSNCFLAPTTESFVGTDGLGNPVSATFTGNGYSNSQYGCGYTPAEIQKAYNLNALYREGYDGTGQTIVIVDWCGSPTIKADANAFSSRFGLPPLTSDNFKIINFPTPSTCAAPDPEINIDVEWAHAIAPGANIVLLVPPTASFADVNNALLYAIANQLGNVISNSYGSEELYTDPSVLVEENLIAEIASMTGISANFSSGDGGDDTFDDPVDNPASVSAPADSPWATAVGGVSLALNSDGSIKWQTGWGTNIDPVALSDTLADPPSYQYFGGGFVGGSGGGASAVFGKPKYQSKLPGKFRQVPDISWLADPYTGGVIAITEPFVSPSLEYQVYGGTSLACPMFSGLWAIANQEAGYPLGSAALSVYSLPAKTITDILPVGSKTNVTAVVTDSLGTTPYPADYLAAPLENTTTYYDAIWNIPLEQDTMYILTFGTDSGLTITKGWDNATGLGVPNAKAFADYFASSAP